MRSFSCCKCTNLFWTSSDLKKHLDSVHTDQCQIRGNIFQHHVTMWFHAIVTHSGRRLPLQFFLLGVLVLLSAIPIIPLVYSASTGADLEKLHLIFLENKMTRLANNLTNLTGTVGSLFGQFRTNMSSLSSRITFPISGSPMEFWWLLSVVGVFSALIPFLLLLWCCFLKRVSWA